MKAPLPQPIPSQLWATTRAGEIREATATRRDDGELGYDVRAQWTAMGTVGHWGHTHIRQNLYAAILTIESVDGVWKVTGMEVLEETRIDQGANAPPAA